MSIDWEKALAVALDSPGLWDEGVEAARNACVAGAPLAAAAITAAAYYDNPLDGGRAMLAAYACFAELAPHAGVSAWLVRLQPVVGHEHAESYVPGFGFVSRDAGAAVRTAARELCAAIGGPRLSFWLEHEATLCAVVGPLNIAGLCALIFLDAEISADEAERRFLLLRLAPALAAAQRARNAGLAHFPFFEDGYCYEGPWPERSACEPCSDAELAKLKQAVGLE